jgi:virginiamycin B lyase
VRIHGVIARLRRGAILGAAVALFSALAGCSGSERPSASGEAASEAPLERLRILATIDLPGEPRLLTAAGGKLWVSFPDTGSVAAVDPRTNRVGGRMQLANGAANSLENPLVGDEHTLWAIDNATERLYRVDTGTQRAQPALNVDGPIGMTLAFGSLWIAEFYPYKVLRVDPETMRILARVPASGPTDVEAGAGSIWILAHHGDEVVRVDPETNRVLATIPLISKGSTPQRMAFGEGALWVSDPQGQSVTRVDPATNKATLEVTMPRSSPTWPYNVSTGGGYVWVNGEWETFKLDPRTNRVTGAVRLDTSADDEGGLTDVYYAFGSVWAPDAKARKLFRIAPGRTRGQ